MSGATGNDPDTGAPGADPGREDRLALSRDLHDAMIQPYVGLKIALEALHREALAVDSVLAGRIAELVSMADLTLGDLRQYVAGIRGGPLPRGEFFLTALQRQSERLERYSGLKVSFDCPEFDRLEGALAAGLYQIISEALSNISRHTHAKRAQVELVCENRMLRLRVSNDRDADREAGVQAAAAFMPRSIDERARALGWEVRVEQDDVKTVVQVLIPQGGNSTE